MRILLFSLFLYNFCYPQCITKLDAGDLQTVVLKSDGTIHYWGNTLFYSTTNVASQIGTATDWKEIGAALRHGIGIKNDGTLWGWGGGIYGQFGNGSQNDLQVPTQIGTETDWNSIFIKNSNTFILKNNGSLWATGFNFSGSSGTGTGSQIMYTFTQVINGSNWKTVSTFGNSVVALKVDNTLWVWGNNQYGQLGTGNTASIDEPVLISNNSWQSIATGSEHSLAVKSDGTLWSWGRNQFGQLGDGTLVNKNIPTQVGTATNWKSVGAGYSMSYALKQDGSLYYFGLNTSGQAGNGVTSTSNILIPTQIGVATNWDALYVGYNFVLGTTTNGALYGWGNNTDGQLGLDDYVTRNTPTLINTCVLATENFTKNNISIHPNPATSTITITSDKPIEKIVVYDVIGKKVYEQVNNATTVDVSSFTKGLYLVQVTSNGIVSKSKFVKE